MRNLLALVPLTWLLLGAAPPLSAEEEAALARREIVYRSDPTPNGAEVIAVCDVAAAPEKVLDAVLDLPPRADEVGPLSEVEVYLTEPTRIAAKFVINVVGSTTTFHVLYAIDRPNLKTTYALDPSKENDLTSSAGSYEVVKVGSTSRLVYRTDVVSEGWVPDWVKQKVTAGPLLEQIEGIRKRAEAAP